MTKMHLLFSLLIASILSSSLLAEQKEYNFAIYSYRSKAVMQERYAPLIAYLNEKLPETKINLKILDIAEIEEAIDLNSVDLLLTTPSQYIRLKEKNSFTTPFATLARYENGKQVSSLGGLILTLKEREDINTLTNLKGTKIATPAKNMFGGYAVQAYELHKAGIDTEKEIKIVASKSHENAIDMLLKKEVDVAFVRTAILEQLINEKKIDKNSFKIINEQNYYNYPFKISTALYPEWPLVAMPNVDEKFLRALIVVLFGLNEGDDVLKHDLLSGFAPAKDYASVEKILKEMKIYPFDKGVQFNLKDVAKKYSPQLATVLIISIIILLLVLMLMRYTSLLKKSKDSFTRLIDDIGEKYTIFSYTEDGTLTYASKGVTFISEKSVDEIINKKWSEVFDWSEDSLKLAYENIEKLKNKEEICNTFHMQFVDEDKKVRTLSITQHATFNKYGRLTSIDGLTQDITNEKKILNELKIERDRFDLAITGTQDGLWDWDLTDNSVLHSEQFEKMLGYDVGELPDTIESWAGQLHPDDMETAYKNVQEYLATKGDGIYESTFRMRTKKGDYIWVRGRGKAKFDVSGMPIRFVGFNTDITNEIMHQDELEHIAKHDNLTHLPNRFLLNELLQNALFRAERYKSIVAILYIDLDGFKDVNDKYGHEAGDEVLKTLATRMQNALRQEDIVARLGGDEFVVVVTDLKESEEIIPLLKRLLHDLSGTVTYHNVAIHQLHVSASIGVTLYPQSHSIGVDALLRQADQAMYDAKTAGKNQYYFFDIESTKVLQEHKAEVERIKTALKNGELELYYQPKINMLSGQVLGFEALIRWNHPEEGIKYPDTFLPVIDKNKEIMLELGRYVFDEAFGQLSRWVEDGFDFTLNINVSSQELHESNFIDSLKECFKKYPKVEPKNIELEILESSALEDMNLVSSVIKKVQEIGVSVALDDFGTGYSTLSYMKNLTVNTIKIDKSFVIDMLHDSSSLSILEAAIGLAEAFRCKVIAEGVEGVEHGSMLIQLGCEVAQGYVASKALRADEAIEWARNYKGIESWKNTNQIKSNDKNVIYAMVEHRNWIRLINLFLLGESHYLPQMNSNHCRFGVWLKSTAMRDYAHKRAILKTLDTLHEKIHNSAIELVKLKKSSNQDREMSEIKDLHEQIIIELEKLVEL